jgi:hypothetical protein
VRALLVFTIIWWTFLLAFTSALLFAPGHWKGPPPSPWFFLLVPGVHWVIALGLLVLLWGWARRRAAISLCGERLVIVEQGRWRTRRREWRCEDVYAISVQDQSNPGGEGSTLRELRVDTWDGPGTGFLAGRGEDDLQWVAAALRQALQLTAQDGR